jgi:hypothetical protein
MLKFTFLRVNSLLFQPSSSLPSRVRILHVELICAFADSRLNPSATLLVSSSIMPEGLATYPHACDSASVGLCLHTFDHGVPSETDGKSDRYHRRKQQVFRDDSGPCRLHWNNWYRDALGMTQVLIHDPYLLNRLGSLLSTSFSKVYEEANSLEMKGSLLNLFKATSGNDFWLNPIRHISSPFQESCREQIQLEINEFTEKYFRLNPQDTSSIMFHRLELEMGNLELSSTDKSNIERFCVQWCAFFSIFDHHDPMPNNVQIVCGMYIEREKVRLSMNSTYAESTVSQVQSSTSATLHSVPLEADLGSLANVFGKSTTFPPESLPGGVPDTGYDTDDTLADRNNPTPPTTAAPSVVDSAETLPLYVP